MSRWRGELFTDTHLPFGYRVSNHAYPLCCICLREPENFTASAKVITNCNENWSLGLRKAISEAYQAERQKEYIPYVMRGLSLVYLEDLSAGMIRLRAQLIAAKLCIVPR